jgi:alpha-ketoglutarate-dependent 2,4-dichlorophenoxyacetate dioxygenase
MGWHRLVQRHEASDRMDLYIAAHAHHIEDVEPDKSRALLGGLSSMQRSLGMCLRLSR